MAQTRYTLRRNTLSIMKDLISSRLGKIFLITINKFKILGNSKHEVD